MIHGFFFACALSISTARRAAIVRHTAFPVCRLPNEVSVGHQYTRAPRAAARQMGATRRSRESRDIKATATAGGVSAFGRNIRTRGQHRTDQPPLPMPDIVSVPHSSLLVAGGGL